MQFEVNRADFHETRAVDDHTVKWTPHGCSRARFGSQSSDSHSPPTTSPTPLPATCSTTGASSLSSPVQTTRAGVGFRRWGSGSVAESGHPDIAVGGRYFGFYPMASDVCHRRRPARQRLPRSSALTAPTTQRPTPTSAMSPPTCNVPPGPGRRVPPVVGRVHDLVPRRRLPRRQRFPRRDPDHRHQRLVEDIDLPRALPRRTSTATAASA